MGCMRMRKLGRHVGTVHTHLGGGAPMPYRETVLKSVSSESVHCAHCTVHCRGLDWKKDDVIGLGMSTDVTKKKSAVKGSQLKFETHLWL